VPHAELSRPPVGDGADWRDVDVATQWASGDRLEGLLALPRRMTADLLSHAGEPVRTVLDVGSGPGAFLDAVLGRLPAAKGIWSDVSDAMQGIAQERLSRYGGRVEFRVLDVADLALVGPPGSLDAVVTSRLSHHLAPGELATFYADATALLGRFGWIANLDHVRLEDPWATRLAEARADLVPPNPSPHRHDRPHPTLEDHLEALDRLGGLDVAVPWRAYSTVLVVARRR
jgi:SAM-dependent methyltransferase